MKKLVPILLFALCMVCAVAALAETSGDYEYAVLEDGTAQITRYNGEASELTIPAVLDGYAVTSIGDWAFDWCKSLTSVTIPASVTSIGRNAFHDYKDGSYIPLDVTMTVERGSYAEQYCKDNNINYTYTDSLDWLNN